MIKKIRNIFKYKIIENLKYFKKMIQLKLEIQKKDKKVLLFGVPFHSNMGDQAQTFCSIKWFQKNYPNYKIYTFDTSTTSKGKYYLLKWLRKKLSQEDKIFIHSGYHTTDLYMAEENMQRAIISIFHDRKIVVLPQTILYTKKEEEEKAKKIYNSHNQLIFLCRDEMSFEKAKDIFSNAKLYLYPDIVTSLIGTKQFKQKRQEILLCMRNDKEAYYDKETIQQLKQELENIDNVRMTDTTIMEKPEYIEKHREEMLNDIFEEYSKYKVIITDRYHGTIFSLIANTPVIVLSSTDHKLSSGVKWFPEEFSDYVCYIQDIDKVKEKVKEIYNKTYSYQLPAYFNVNYYDKLKGIIEGE